MVHVGHCRTDVNRIAYGADRCQVLRGASSQRARRKTSYLEVAGPKRELEHDGTAGLAEADKILGRGESQSLRVR